MAAVFLYTYTRLHSLTPGKTQACQRSGVTCHSTGAAHRLFFAETRRECSWSCANCGGRRFSFISTPWKDGRGIGEQNCAYAECGLNQAMVNQRF